MKAKKVFFVLVVAILVGTSLLIPSMIKKPQQKDGRVIASLKSINEGSWIRYKGSWNPIMHIEKDIYGNVCEVTIPYEFGLKLKEEKWGYIDSVVSPENKAWKEIAIRYLLKK